MIRDLFRSLVLAVGVVLVASGVSDDVWWFVLLGGFFLSAYNGLVTR